MIHLEALIKSAITGDDQAFAEIIRRFQDMAFGYAYTLVKDLHLAEDAAQEAFVEAYYNLKRLKNPAAFPVWLKRIVQFRCNRILGRKKLPQEPIDSAASIASKEPEPYEIIERQDIEEEVFNAINGLSQHLREVTTLFFINGYTKNEIAEFLEIPENTVKSRLKASRKQLQRSLNMSDIIKETLNNNKLPEDFARKVIEGVTKVTFGVRQANRKSKELISPQDDPFPSCLCACLEKMGENYGHKIISIIHPITKQKKILRLNNLYVLLMGASGAAFRLIWNPQKWDPSNYDLLIAATDTLEPFRRAFDAVGYEFEMIGNKEYTHESDLKQKFFKQYENFDYFRVRIINSIHDNNRPVIALGVLGPPECCVVTGYDESADVLIGWNFFQDMPEMAQGTRFEQSGYFRQRDWYKNTPGLIIIGKKRPRPQLRDIYYNALKWALTLARTEDIHDRKGGLAAYEAWADDLLVDENFSADDPERLKKCVTAHEDAMNIIPENRSYYGGHFLKQMIESKEVKSILHDQLNEAIECYTAMGTLVWQYWKKFGTSRSKALIRNLSKPKIRQEVASIILQIRDKEAEAIGIIENILEKW